MAFENHQNFDDSGFLFGSSLVGADGFLKSHGVYLGSAFGTSTPTYTMRRTLYETPQDQSIRNGRKIQEHPIL